MTTTTTAPPPKYKRSWKNYLLNPRFQLKWTSYAIVVALVISAILGGFLFKTSNDLTEQSREVIKQGDALLAESQKNSELVKMQIKKEYADTPELAETFNKSASDLDKDLQAKHAKLEQQAADTAKKQQTMLYSLVGGLTLLVILLGLLGIYFTHKVVGPIHKMKSLLRQVGDGKLNFEGRLRKGDELQDFFEVFAAMVEKLKARQAIEVEELTAAMAAAKESGANEVAISKITFVRDEMKAALEK